MMAVGPKRGHNQEHGHSGKQKNTGPVIILFVFKEKEDHHCGYIKEPQEVGDDEELTEGDVIVNRHMDDLIIFCDGLLQIAEPA